MNSAPSPLHQKVFFLLETICSALIYCICMNQLAFGQSTKVEAIPDDIWGKMQERSWHRNLGCPSRARLAFLTVPYHDFSGKLQTGHLIVAKDSSQQVATIFDEIFKSDFRIEKIMVVDEYNGNDKASMIDNNTSAFNCRLKTGGKSLSEHSYGSAIDINPVQNPYVSRHEVLPESSKRFADPRNRTAVNVGLIVEGDAVTTAFRRQKWIWGGDWRSLKDYQHFSRNGK